MRIAVILSQQCRKTEVFKALILLLVSVNSSFLSGCTDRNANTITSVFFGEKGDTSQTNTTGARPKFSKYTVIKDDNADGTVNPGETVYLLVYLKNSGTSQANNVKATFASTSSYVSGISPTTSVSFGTISAGGENEGDYSGLYGNDGQYDYYTFKFTVSSSTPAGTSLNFSISIVDAQNNAWSDSFAVPVR